MARFEMVEGGYDLVGIEGRVQGIEDCADLEERVCGYRELHVVAQ